MNEEDQVQGQDQAEQVSIAQEPGGPLMPDWPFFLAVGVVILAAFSILGWDWHREAVAKAGDDAFSKATASFHNELQEVRENFFSQLSEQQLQYSRSRIVDCLAVDGFSIVGLGLNTAVEVHIRNSCHQDIGLAYLRVAYFDRLGYRIGFAWRAVDSLKANEKISWRFLGPPEAVSVSPVEVTADPADVTRW